jgi:hypothetical protein
MAGSLYKNYIGKEDISIQTNTSAAETFSRLSSTGSTVSLTKFPDIWSGTGKISVAECETSATDPGDISETIAAGDLTHDVLKSKINALLAAMRVAGFFR